MVKPIRQGRQSSPHESRNLGSRQSQPNMPFESACKCFVNFFYILTRRDLIELMAHPDLLNAHLHRPGRRTFRTC
jgi:hypothetical protein